MRTVVTQVHTNDHLSSQLHCSINTSVICGIVSQVKKRLWIATADIKDMYVDADGQDMVLPLEVLDEMVKRGRMVAISCKRSGRAVLIG